MWDSTITRAQLKASISRLQKLDKVPEEPRENELRPATSSARCLSIERENEIVSNIAFLSAMSDSHLEVMAVCLEEDRDERGATIRLASNTRDLAAMTSGFEVLARTLETATTRGLSQIYLSSRCALTLL